MADLEKILLPDVGGEEVEIIEICVSVGDTLEEEDAIITVETEKASMDIPAVFAGNIAELNVKLGDKVSEGTVICTMQRAGSSTSEVKEVAEKDKVSETPFKEVSNLDDSQAELIKHKCKTLGSEMITTVSEEVLVPDIGDDGEVDVIEILVSIGDSICEEEGLITLETEKATMDVPVPFCGFVREILVKPGDKVSKGTAIAKVDKIIVVDVDTKEVEELKAAPVVQTVTKTTEEAAKIQTAPTSKNTKAHASPSIRRLAREFGIDLSLVTATGRKNRIMKDDVKAYVKQALSNPTPMNTTSSTNSGFGFDLPVLKEIDFSKFGDIETKELTKIQKISGPSLHRNWVGMPHVTQFDEADISELEAFRKEQNATIAKKKQDFKISPLVFILKAVAKALSQHPIFNSSLSSNGQSIILKKYIHIAVAVDTPNGLVVPVIRDVDKKGIHELSQELIAISQKARDGKLKIEDIQGASFTISSLGGIGGTSFTPIINAPEVAILGVSKSEMKPKWNGSEFEPKLMLPLSISYDHRVIDGAEGARFSTTLSNILSDIRLLVL